MTNSQKTQADSTGIFPSHRVNSPGWTALAFSYGANEHCRETWTRQTDPRVIVRGVSGPKTCDGKPRVVIYAEIILAWKHSYLTGQEVYVSVIGPIWYEETVTERGWKNTPCKFRGVQIAGNGDQISPALHKVFIHELSSPSRRFATASLTHSFDTCTNGTFPRARTRVQGRWQSRAGVGMDTRICAAWDFCCLIGWWQNHRIISVEDP